MVFGRVAQLTPGSVSSPFDFRFKLVKTRAGGILGHSFGEIGQITHFLVSAVSSCGKRNGQQV